MPVNFRPDFRVCFRSRFDILHKFYIIHPGDASRARKKGENRIISNRTE